MQEIKHRTAICTDALKPYWATKAISIPNCELACLQLRKMYELVAFAALSANKSKYQMLRAKFEKDWRLVEILRIIERFNPGFLPVAFTDVEGVIIDSATDYFDIPKLSKWHSDFNTILHAKNPYKKETDYVALLEKCGTHLNRFVSIMNRHKVNVVKDEVFYLVTMQGAEDGNIQVATFYRVDGESIKEARLA